MLKSTFSGLQLCCYLHSSSCYRFRDIGVFGWKIACFPPAHPSGGTPCDINVIYILLKSTFNGLQFLRWHYGSISIRCWLPNLRNPAKFRENSKSTSRSSKVIDLGVNRKCICDV